MSRALSKRLAKLEAATKPPALPVPNVLRLERGETIADAARRFDAEYPKRSKHHCVLVVPARDRSATDDADFDAGFYAQQAKLIADAKSEPRKDR